MSGFEYPGASEPSSRNKPPETWNVEYRAADSSGRMEFKELNQALTSVFACRQLDNLKFLRMEGPTGYFLVLDETE